MPPHLPAAADHYRRCLGFAIDWIDGALGLAGISRGDCRLCLATPAREAGEG